MQISSQNIEQRRKAGRSSGLLAGQDLSVDPPLLHQDGPPAYVLVFEGECLLWAQPGVGEDAHERRVAQPMHGVEQHLPAQRLDVDGAQRLDRACAAHPWLGDQLDDVDSAPVPFHGPREHALQQSEAASDRGRAHPVLLEFEDELREDKRGDLAQLHRAEPPLDVRAPKAAVLPAGARRAPTKRNPGFPLD
jgi:hypothetical protein